MTSKLECLPVISGKYSFARLARNGSRNFGEEGSKIFSEFHYFWFHIIDNEANVLYIVANWSFTV